MESFNSQLKEVVRHKRSWLCVGLDMNPDALGKNDLTGLKEHSFRVIDATREFAVAYKPNFAFFERWGAVGFAWLEEIVEYIGNEHIKIADAKRGDIGSTSKAYASTFLEGGHLGRMVPSDALTINPYLGEDACEPFIEIAKKRYQSYNFVNSLKLKDVDSKFNNILFNYYINRTQWWTTISINKCRPSYYKLIKRTIRKFFFLCIKMSKK